MQCRGSGLAVAFPHGQGEQGVFAFRPHGVQVLTGRAQPAQLHAIHHGESRIKQPTRINAFGHTPTNVERGVGIMQLSIGEIFVCRVVRVDRFGAQRGTRAAPADRGYVAQNRGGERT